MANGHGGARAGAGRKAKTEKFKAEIDAAERQIADRLPGIIDDLLMLAHGRFEQIQETWEPAGLIQIEEELVTDKGMFSVRKPAFPDLDPKALVLTKRTRAIAAPDRAAGQYLVDRILGKPTTRVEADGEDGGPLFKVYVGLDVDRV